MEPIVPPEQAPRLERQPTPSESGPLERRPETVVVESGPVAPVVAVPSTPPPVTAPVADRYRQIEHILEADLSELYFRMAPQDQELFRRKGEETARLISETIDKPKVSIKKIVTAIKAWLRVIPGINRFFIEQEAKIKADRITAGIEPDRLTE